MKKTYIAPSMEVELFELDASIASNCVIQVLNGPEIIGQFRGCDDYYAITGQQRPSANSRMSVHNVSFYDTEVCDCYTTGGGAFYWMS